MEKGAGWQHRYFGTPVVVEWDLLGMSRVYCPGIVHFKKFKYNPTSKTYSADKSALSKDQYFTFIPIMSELGDVGVGLRFSERSVFWFYLKHFAANISRKRPLLSTN
jgi:hypothetical protein